MPRRRPDPAERRAAQLAQEATDRRLREQILARQAAEAPPAPEPPAPAAPEPPAAPAAPEPEPFDAAAWAANSRITGLMRSRYGPNWARNRSLHRLAERALLDLKGQGDGKALRSLLTYKRGTYLQALEAKYGPL